MPIVALIFGLTTTALAADVPCYGHTEANRLDTDHFWVEWADGVIDQPAAQVIGDAAEHARVTYLDMGWPMTDEPVVITVVGGNGGGISGLTETSSCDGIGPVPRVTLTVGHYTPNNAKAVTAHELGHVAQYGYMGAYLDSVASWTWWMEATAVWLAAHDQDSQTDWGRSASGYLGEPWQQLQQVPPAYAVPELSDHMYGETVLTRFLEQVGGGPDAVRQTWAWGAQYTGQAIAFPDAIDALGLDFDAFWAQWMATTTTVEMDWSDALRMRIAATDVDALPFDGAPDTMPQGLGLVAVHFLPSTGAAGKALQVDVDGEADVPWHVVLVRTVGADPGSPLIDYVSVPFDDVTGKASGWITGFDGSIDGWLVVSPEAGGPTHYDVQYSAQLIDDPGPMDSVVHPSQDTGTPQPVACACETGPTGGSLGLLLLPLLALRRRSRRRLG